jgi:hypothetical protein
MNMPLSAKSMSRLRDASNVDLPNGHRSLGAPQYLQHNTAAADPLAKPFSTPELGLDHP